MSRALKKKYRVKRWAHYLAYDANYGEDGEKLTEADVIDLFRHQKGKCYWTGVPMKVSKYRHDPYQPSLDRLDNNLPHTIDNVVLCCLSMNLGRNKTNVIDWQKFIGDLKRSFENKPEGVEHPPDLIGYWSAVGLKMKRNELELQGK